MRKISGIEKSTLEFILEICKSSHPKEMVGLLRAEDEFIKDVIFAPGTVTSEKSAMIRIDRLPVKMGTVGSVHSHPSGNPNPSEVDMEMFSQNGRYHLIVFHPYREGDWVCYGKNGKKIELEVLESKNNESDLWSEELERIKKDFPEFVDEYD